MSQRQPVPSNREEEGRWVMTAAAKTRSFRRARMPPLHVPASGEKVSKVSPDYLVFALLLLLMTAMLALAMWLASIGGATVEPGDYWTLMP
jgi:hypothetical protein